MCPWVSLFNITEKINLKTCKHIMLKSYQIVFYSKSYFIFKYRDSCIEKIASTDNFENIVKASKILKELGSFPFGGSVHKRYNI